jgi:glutamine amidotransferase PdxT
MGHVLTRSLVYAGIVSTVMWLLINHTEFYKEIHSATLIYTVLIGGCAVITYLWSRKQYRLYLQGDLGVQQ